MTKVVDFVLKTLAVIKYGRFDFAYILDELERTHVSQIERHLYTATIVVKDAHEFLELEIEKYNCDLERAGRHGGLPLRGF